MSLHCLYYVSCVTYSIIVYLWVPKDNKTKRNYFYRSSYFIEILVEKLANKIFSSEKSMELENSFPFFNPVYSLVSVVWSFVCAMYPNTFNQTNFTLLFGSYLGPEKVVITLQKEIIWNI